MNVDDQTQTANDPMGLDAEFSRTPVSAAQMAAAAATPNQLTAEYDFGDGPVTLTGTSQKDLLDQAVKMQGERMLRQQQALQLQQAADPSTLLNTYEDYTEIPPITAEEEQMMAINWAQNPVGYTKRILEAELGMPFDQVQAQLAESQKLQAQIYGHRIGAEFQQRHPEYFPCDENGEKMIGYLNANNLQYTPGNYELAYVNLRAARMLKEAPADTQTTDPSASTALSDSDSFGFTGLTAAGLDVSEIERQAREMPLDQLRQMVFAPRRR